MTFGRAALLVFLVGALAAALGIPSRASYGAQVTGDEPQYLITAQSLLRDGDLDVSDQIEERSYEPFHEITIDRQTEPTEDGREVSPHDPLLPTLLALPLWLGGWVGAKAFLALLNGALAALLLALAVRRMGLPVRTSAVLIGLFAASAPLAVYGSQIYPEIVAALCVAAASWTLLDPRTQGMPLLVGAVVALPWLSIKYTPVAAALAVWGLWELYRGGRWAALWRTIAVYLFAAATYVVAHLQWYGGITPYASGDHFATTGEFSVVGTGVNLAGRSSRLIGLLIDRNFGLIPWQPLFLLLIPAAMFVLRRGPRRERGLLVVAGVGWLNATFVALTMHGWWWPGRQVVVILPLVVLVVLRWVARYRTRTHLASLLGGAGVLTFLWLAVEGATGQLTLVVDPFLTSAPVFTLLSSVLPDYTDGSAETWFLHGIWIAVTSAIAAWSWRASRPIGHTHVGPDPAPAADLARP